MKGSIRKGFGENTVLQKIQKFDRKSDNEEARQQMFHDI